MATRLPVCRAYAGLALVAMAAQLVRSAPSNTPPAPMQLERLQIGPEGKEFSVTQRSSAFIPGSGERIEVFLGDITGGSVRLGIRTAEGETLAAPRSVAPGYEVVFNAGGEDYTLQVTRLRNLLIGNDYAVLRVCRSSQAVPREDPETRRLRKAIREKLIELMEQKLAHVDHYAQRADALLAAGNRDDAGIALEESRRCLEEATAGLRWIQDFTARGEKTANSLSILKIRVARERRQLKRISENAAPAARAWASVLDGVFFQDLPQEMQAEIVETHIVGKRFADGTLLGKLRPLQKRGDLQPGRTIELEQVPRVTGMRRLEEGQTYWVVITPPLAADLAPRLVGTGRRAEIAFAARSAAD